MIEKYIFSPQLNISTHVKNVILSYQLSLVNCPHEYKYDIFNDYITKYYTKCLYIIKQV